MITNRNINSVSLFEDALDEVIESAQESGVDDAELAAALRARAAAMEESDASEPDADASEPDADS